MKRNSSVLVVLVTLLAGCAGTPDAPEPKPIPEPKVERARDLAAELQGTLKTALMESLTAGPAEAIEACAVMAPDLAAGLSTDGVRIGRTSHRLRNPANAAPAWVEPLVEEYRETAPGAESQALWIDDSTVGYVEPIYVQKPCLACHGEAVADDVLQEIQATYPQDRATGFHEGEFRGVIWVEID
jgi:hypothetical protein